MLKTMILLSIISVVCACIQNMIGFGYTALAVSFMTMLFPYTKGVALMQCIGFISTAYVAAVKYRHIKWKVLLPILIPAIVINTIFTLLSVKATGSWIYILLGLMFLIMALFFFVFSDKVHVKPSLGSGAFMGSLVGVGSGLFGVAGPPAAIYMLTATNDKEEYIGSMNMIFTGMNIVGIALRFMAGAFTSADFPYIIVGWITILVGTVLGLKILKLINIEKFRKLVYIFVGLNGLYIILTHL